MLNLVAEGGFKRGRFAAVVAMSTHNEGKVGEVVGANPRPVERALAFMTSMLESHSLDGCVI